MEELSNIRKKEIIEFVISYMLSHNDYWRGICSNIYSVYHNQNIGEDEQSEFSKWFNKQKPTRDNQFKEFTNHEHFKHYTDFWWHRTTEGREQRIKFLEALRDTLT